MQLKQRDILLLSQILWRTLVISNADDDVADNIHAFLPVVLPCSGVGKPFQYDSRNFRYALVAPPISNWDSGLTIQEYSELKELPYESTRRWIRVLQKARQDGAIDPPSPWSWLGAYEFLYNF